MAQAAQLSADELFALRQKFNEMDKNRDGVIDFYELGGAHDATLTEEEVLQVMAFFDKDKDGTISFEEYVSAVTAVSAGMDVALEQDTPAARGMHNMRSNSISQGINSVAEAAQQTPTPGYRHRDSKEQHYFHPELGYELDQEELPSYMRSTAQYSNKKRGKYDNDGFAPEAEGGVAVASPAVTGEEESPGFLKLTKSMERKKRVASPASTNKFYANVNPNRAVPVGNGAALTTTPKTTPSRRPRVVDGSPSYMQTTESQNIRIGAKKAWQEASAQDLNQSTSGGPTIPVVSERKNHFALPTESLSNRLAKSQKQPRILHGRPSVAQMVVKKNEIINTTATEESILVGNEIKPFSQCGFMAPTETALSRRQQKAPRKAGSATPLHLEAARIEDGRMCLNNSGMSRWNGLEKRPDIRRLEFLYLRNNEISNFDGLTTLMNLKVLDLSDNLIVSFEGMATRLPQLKQLYLNSNELETFLGFPSLPNLEVLSVSNNRLISFRGLNKLPNLVMLSAAGNFIESFDGLPFFPELSSIRLEGNPIAEEFAAYRSSVQLVCSNTLEKIDGQPVTERERENALMCHRIVPVAYKHGFQPEAGPHAENIRPQILKGAADQYMAAFHKELFPAPYSFKRAAVEGPFVEDEELTADFSYLNDGQEVNAEEHDIIYQWFRCEAWQDFEPIIGATSKTYKATVDDVYCHLMVVCNVILQSETLSLCAVTDEIRPAAPTGSDPTIVGVLAEGETLTAKAAYHGGYWGLSQFTWYRKKGDITEMIVKNVVQPMSERDLKAAKNGIDTCQYVITQADVGSQITFEYTPVRSDGERGESVSATSDHILLGNVSFSTVDPQGPIIAQSTVSIVSVLSPVTAYLVGSSVEGEAMSVVFKTVGMESDPEVSMVLEDAFCKTTWSRGKEPTPDPKAKAKKPAKPKKGAPAPVPTYEFEEVSPGGASYSPSKHDIGTFLKVEYSLVTKDGTCVGSVTLQCPPEQHTVVAAQPQILEASLDHVTPCYEFQEVEPTGRYIGGDEGESEFFWFRSENANSEGELVSTDRKYAIVSEDVGKYLSLEWTPVRSDGVRGDSVTVRIETPVKEGVPTATDVSVERAAVGGRSFFGSGKYHGGIEGLSEYLWERIDAAGQYTLIGDALRREYRLRAEDAGCRLRFGYQPRRDDGVAGNVAWSDPTELIHSELSRAQNVIISGTRVEGEALVPEGDFDLDDGEVFCYQWYRNGAAIEGATDKEYVPVVADVNAEVSFATWAMRSADGKTGEETKLVAGTIKPGTPSIKDIKIVGDATNMSEIKLEYTYFGGVEGTSLISWYRADPSTPEGKLGTQLHGVAKIPDSPNLNLASNSYRCDASDVERTIVVSVTPVRNDGIQGEASVAKLAIGLHADCVDGFNQYKENAAPEIPGTLAKNNEAVNIMVDVKKFRIVNAASGKDALKTDMGKKFTCLCSAGSSGLTIAGALVNFESEAVRDIVYRVLKTRWLEANQKNKIPLYVW